MKRITRLVLLTTIIFSAVFLQPPQVVKAANFPAQMNKSFTPISISAGGISVLSVTIYNPNSFELTSAHYHDFFPAGIYVSTPLTVTNNCGGSITNAANGILSPGDTSFQLNGGTVPPQSGGSPGSCTVTVAVTSTTPGNLINTIPASELTSSGDDNGTIVPITNDDPASATLQVAAVLPPSLSKSFSLTTTWVGQSTRLTINITNNDPVTALTETTLTDTFPVPFVLAGTINPTLTNCGAGTLTGPGGIPLASGQSELTLNNGTISPGATCSIAVNVVSNTQGIYTNTIPAGPAGAGSIRTRQGVTNAAAASAGVNVQAVGIGKTFNATTIQETDYSVLTITLRNPTSAPYMGVGLVDTLPAGLSYVTIFAPTLSAGCNPPTGTATVTATALTIANVRIPAGTVTTPGTCVVTARVTGVANATAYTNTIPAGAMTGPVTNVLPATAQLTVQARSIGVLKSFSPSTVNNGGTSTMTITLQNRTRTAYTGVGLIDNLPAGLVFTGAAPTLSASCNPPTATATLSGGPPPTRLTLANATIPGSTSANPVSNPGICTITAQVRAISLGTWTNTLPVGSVCTTPASVCNGSAGSGSITVVNPLPVRLTKSFTNATIPAGGNSRLRLSIIAPADTALTNFSITDNLPTGVSVSNSSPPVFSAGCGAAGNRTLTALTGATSINLVLNTFAANATCNLDVWVTSSTPGTVTNTVTPANITNTQGRTIAANATANLSVTTLSMSKAFFPPTVNPNGLSTLTITLVNTNSSPLVSVGLLDSLPGSAANGIRIATPPNASTDCGGTLTTVANNQNITLANGTIPAQIGAVPGRCTIVVNVIGRGATATYTNTIPTTNVIGTIQGTATTIRPVANATAQIRVAPIGIQVVKGFNPLTVFGGASSVLSVQLINPNNSALSGIQFTDTMPVGMIIANPPNFNTGTCGGTLTGTVGSNVFTFSGGVLPASSTCTLTLRATMTVNGNLTNTIGAGAVTTFNGATNAQPAAATLTNLPGASVSKAFAPNPIYTGEYSLLTITIQNTGNIALSGMGLIDNLPAGTSIAGIPAPPPVNNCGGSLTAAAGTQLIQLTGGSLLGSQSCTLVIPVTSNVANDYLNTIPAGRLTSTEGATNQDPTSDTLRVLSRASLGDFVWNDTNANGIQDEVGTGISGVTVNLLDSTLTQIATTTTSAGGAYSFTNLVPGTYSVEFVNPGGYTFSPQNAGGDDTVDSDANTTTGRTGPYTLASGENNPTIDAGLYQLASLGDFVWNDTNANGIQDEVGTGISGVTVNLLDSTLTQIATTTTSAGGAYSFTNLVPGTYSVEFVNPGGYTFSPQNAGGDDTVDSDANTTTGRTGPYTLASGENNPTIDAGLYQLASLGDFVWNDTNANGIQDEVGTGISGVTVNLLDSTLTQIATTTTSAGGAYSFTNLVPGTYSVEFVNPGGYTFSPQNAGGDDTVDSDANTTTGRTGPYTLASGENNPTIDAGLYQLASLGDFVWNDTNANGIQDEVGTGISGVTVNLLDSTLTQIATTTTSAGGAYSFTNLVPGTYSVEFVNPGGYTFSPQNAGGDDTVDSDANTTTGRTGPYTLASGENNPTIDAGLYQLASLGDFVWNDTNANGIQDEVGTGISGVTVNLLDSTLTQIATTTTSAGGAYSFTNLVPGTYSVEFVNPGGYTFSPQNAGGDDTVDSDANTTTGRTGPYTLASGENNPTIDAGLYQLASLGDFVWNDTNANGIQDEVGTGISGVTVNLLDSTLTQIATTTTSAGGAYSFTNLVPGTYSVEFVNPGGYTFSPQNAGGDDTVDSDANTTTGRTGPYTLASGENNPTIDAGLYQPEINVTKVLSAVTFTNPDVARMTYTITIGPNAIPLTLIQAVDDLEVAFAPQSFTIISLTATNLTVNPAYDGLTGFDTNLLTGSDSLDAGESGVITLVVDLTLNQNDPTATYINEVEASGLPPTGPRVTDRSSATGPLFADPAVTKSGDPTRVFVGELVTFTLTVSNNGNQTATDVVVTDPLPSNMSVVSAVSTSGTVTIIPPRTVQVDIGDMDPDDVVTITIIARVNSTGSPPIINQVELTTTSPTDFDPNNRSSITLVVLNPTLPETGFAPGRFTRIPAQPPSIVYSTNDELSLTIPSLKINLPIVGIPKSGDSWDVTWLDNRAGWLNGTSYPTWNGNSVITGHVYLSNGLPGPFLNVGKLNYGDRVIVRAYGKDYIYEVRSVRTIKPYAVASVLRHEDRSWITLLTCKGFNEDLGNYDQRTVVRAVLISVK